MRRISTRQRKKARPTGQKIEKMSKAPTPPLPQEGVDFPLSEQGYLEGFFIQIPQVGCLWVESEQ